MRIRPGTPDDAEGIVAIARRSITISAATWYSPHQLQRWSSGFSTPSIVDAITTSEAFLVAEDNRLAGFANLISASEGRSELDLLYIDPDFSGRGVARTLIIAIEDEARARGISDIWVDASIPATRVLEGLDYVVEGVNRKHFGGVDFENVWLRKRLGT